MKTFNRFCYACILVFLSVSFSWASLQDGLIGWWNCNEGEGEFIGDSSTYDNQGLLSESLFLPEDGCGGAISFIGDDSFILVPHHDSLNVDNEFVFSAWLRPEEIQQTWNTIISKEHDEFAVYLKSPGRISVWLNDSEALLGNRNLSMRTWTHIAVSLKDGILSIYINGELDQSTEYDDSIEPNISDLYFGSALGTRDFYKGAIDDIRLYNRGLLDCEAKAMTIECDLVVRRTLSAEYTFDNDAEGWTSDGDGYMEYRNEGGNPGGYIHGVDYALGDWWFFVSPWTGDLSAFIGNELQFDLFGTNISYDGEVSILSDGEEYLAPLPRPTQEWTETTILLNGESFNLDDAEFAQVMSNVSQFRLRCEFYSGPDQAGLDNVRVFGIDNSIGDIMGVFQTSEGNGIEGVEITLMPGGETYTTNECGIFEFNQLAAGEYQLSTQYNEESYARDVIVLSGERSIVVFTTEEEPDPTEGIEIVLDGVEIEPLYAIQDSLLSCCSTIISLANDEIIAAVSNNESIELVWYNQNQSTKILSIYNMDLRAILYGSDNSILLVVKISDDPTLYQVYKVTGPFAIPSSIGDFMIR
jgi:hypothetical protein